MLSSFTYLIFRSAALYVIGELMDSFGSQVCSIVAPLALLTASPVGDVANERHHGDYDKDFQVDIRNRP